MRQGIDKLYLGTGEVSNRGEQSRDRRAFVVWPEKGRTKRSMSFWAVAHEYVAAQRAPLRLRRHVGTILAKLGAMGGEVPDHL